MGTFLRSNAVTSIAACILLPLFFVLHGFVENSTLIAGVDAFVLFITYVAITGFLLLVFQVLFKSLNKAALLVFLVLSIHFFFGSVHDRLKMQFGNALVSSYSFVFLAIAFLLITAVLIIWKRRTLPSKLFSFLTLLLVVFIVYDGANFLFKNSINNFKNFKGYGYPAEDCNTCGKPDLYLIVADEFAGDKELKDLFGFNNSAFANALNTRGFHIVRNATSNYNFTPFSIASVLDMDYLDIDIGSNKTGDIPGMLRKINTNQVTRFFSNLGYTVVNNAIFDLPGAPRVVSSSFLPNKTKLITAQTIVSRVERDLWFHLPQFLQGENATKEKFPTNWKSNQFLFARTLETIALPATPKFSYTHFSMPHPPYYYDSVGIPIAVDSAILFDNRKLYTGYLQYTSKKLLTLMDSILVKSKQPPIIIFISDHGFRYGLTKNESHYNFMNYCAIFTPQKKYAAFYDGLSLVNLFRAVLNTEFGQQLKMLPDKQILLSYD